MAKGGGQNKNGRSRKLSKQEQSLWQKVTKDVIHHQVPKMPEILAAAEPIGLKSAKPSPRKKLKSTVSTVSKVDPLESGYLLKLMQRFDNNSHPAHEAGAKPDISPIKHAYRAPQVHQSQPENLPLDRNIRQKLQRGRADIEARLDLHGYNRDNAQTRLISFLRSSYQQGFKTVIVVTGKGDGSIARHSLHSADFFSMPEQRAVLRASIGEWLNSHEASQYVIGWQPAHPKHGGGGAVYVRIRSRKH